MNVRYTPSAQMDHGHRFCPVPTYHARHRVAELAPWVMPRDDKTGEHPFLDLPESAGNAAGLTWAGPVSTLINPEETVQLGILMLEQDHGITPAEPPYDAAGSYTCAVCGKPSGIYGHPSCKSKEAGK